jgi:hypothetical protein
MNMQRKAIVAALAAAFATILSGPAAAGNEAFWDTEFLKGLQRMKVMKMMDTNQDHKLTREEFMSAQGRLFDTMDRNQDGSIDEGEWMLPWPGHGQG